MKNPMRHFIAASPNGLHSPPRSDLLPAPWAVGSVATLDPRRGHLVQRPQTAQAGFMLLEILVALAILTTALAAIIPLLTDTAQRTDHAELTQRALVLAEAKMSETGTAFALKSAVLQGTEGKSTWTVHIQPAEAGLGESALGVAVYHVVVSARHREGDREQTVTLRTLRAGAKQ